MIPKVIETIGGYQYEWEKEKINISVNRLRTHNDGTVKGELVVTTSAEGYAPHLHQAQFNFSSSDSRKKLAKVLEERYKGAVWDSILEQLCVYTLDKVRQGEPVIDLWTTDKSSPPQFILEPFLIRNYPTIFFGDPSSAKSIVALVLSIAMLLPWEDNPIGLSAPDKGMSILWLDYETDEATVAWQASCIQRGMDLPNFAIHYRHCSQALSNDLEQVQKAIGNTQADVIVIDSIGLACGGELKEAAPVLAFFSALRKLKITSLILAHTSKDRDNKNKTPYGSVFFEAYGRSIWELRKVQEVGEDELDVGLFHRKPPPFGKLHKPLGFKISFDNDKTVISQQDPHTVGEFLERMGTQQRIMELLKEGPASIREVAEALGISEGNARLALKRLKDKGRVVKIGEKYALQAQYEYGT